MRLVYGWAPDSRLASSGEGSGPPAAREPSAEPWEKGEERRRRRGVGGAVEGEGERWKERRRRRDRWGRMGREVEWREEGDNSSSSSHSNMDVVTKLTIMFCGRR